MTKFELTHLEKLADDAPATVRFSEMLVRELTRLDAIRFIRPTHVAGINAIGHEHWTDENEFDLKQYVRLTAEGQEYLRLRDRLVGKTATEDEPRP